MKVKINKLGQDAKDIYVPMGSKVSLALEASGDSATGCQITVDMQPASPDTILNSEGSIITLTQKVSGGN